ncbi:MAG: hypothetical protein V7L07_05075 [Nostoc sp.]
MMMATVALRTAVGIVVSLVYRQIPGLREVLTLTPNKFGLYLLKVKNKYESF